MGERHGNWKEPRDGDPIGSKKKEGKRIIPDDELSSGFPLGDQGESAESKGEKIVMEKDGMEIIVPLEEKVEYENNGYMEKSSIGESNSIEKSEKKNDFSTDKRKDKIKEKKAIVAFDPKEVTTKYWIDGIVELPNEQKIDYLNKKAIKRLHEIISSKDTPSKFKKRAEARVESLQKTIKNIENMMGEEGLEWVRKQIDKINNWGAKPSVKDGRLLNILLKNNIPQEDIDKMSVMEAWKKFEAIDNKNNQKNKNMKNNNIESEPKEPPKPENASTDEKVEPKVELNPPDIEDIDFYNIRIERANKNIDAWERLRDKASSIGNKSEVEKRQTKIDMERAAIKVMEDKRQKAEMLKKEAPGKVERKRKGRAKETSFEGFKKDSVAEEDRKRIEAMMIEKYTSRGVTKEQIDNMRRKMPTRWENEVRSLLEAEKKGKIPTSNIEEEKTQRLSDLKKIRDEFEALKGAMKDKPKSQFEEFEESIKNVVGEKPNYEVLKDAYLRKLGWKVEYNYLHTKAWLIDNATGKFVAENGELTDKKKDKKEFPTQSGFSVETPFFRFLKEQLKKKLGGTESQLEAELSPEEEKLKKWKEAFPLDSEAQEITEEANKEAWEKIHVPSGMAEAWKAMQETPEKKPKSFWQRFKDFMNKKL